jgi:lysyl-tRNA synthetase class 2
MPFDTQWRPTAPLLHLRLRANLLQDIRAYFAEQGVLEVETPILTAGVTDPHIDSIAVHNRVSGDKSDGLFLQTSPEYAMKRLLAAGSGPIYQIARAFRAGELGRRHNPEFSLLEWYRPGFNHQQLMDEVEALVARLLSMDAAAKRISYSELFRQCLALDPLSAKISALRYSAETNGINIDDPGDDRDLWLELLFSHIIEPQIASFGRMVFVTDYPATQAALARIDEQGRAARFELYVDGLELANGFHELLDPIEQRQRFIQDNHRRRAMGKTEMPIDESFLQALEYGLPDCAGVALGLDRLLMCVAGVGNIEQVLAFRQ